MSDRRGIGHRVLRRLMPRGLREKYGDEIESLLDEELAAARARGAWPWIRSCSGVAFDAARRIAYERVRQLRRGSRENLVPSFVADLRFALRSFRRQPGATALVGITLCIAVAANAAVFAIVDGLFLKPFPFAESSRLVDLNETAPRWNLDFAGINYPDFAIWKASTSSFESMAVYDTWSVNLADGSATQRVSSGLMSRDLMQVLRVKPVLGRTFTAEEDAPNGPKVVLLGEDLWRAQFGADSAIVGKMIRINSRAYVVVGVLPRAAEFPARIKLWVPLQENPRSTEPCYCYEGVARLKPGVSLAQARRDLERAHVAVWALNDKAHNVSPRAMPLRDRMNADFRSMGDVLAAGALLVLLVACANVAGTMLARGIVRRREVAIRVALGASGSRIARQMLTESLALAAMAGGFGVAFGEWTLHTVAAMNPDLLPPWMSVDVAPRTIGFAVAAIGAVALLFGTIPAMALRRTRGVGNLIGAGLRSSRSIPERRALSAIVIIEVALAVVLLAGSSLLLQAYVRLRRADPGFRAQGVAAFRVALPSSEYRDGNEQRAFFESLLASLARIPGVDHVGAVSCPPFGCHWGNFYKAEGAPAPRSGQQEPVTLFRYASPDYFAAMGIRLVRGRFYAANEGNARSGARPVVINEELAHQLWPNVMDPVGKRLTVTADTSANWSTVVGVVHDVKHYGLTEPMRPGLYFPLARVDSSTDLPSLAVVVHTRGDAAALFPEIRSAVRRLDPELPVYDATTMEAALEKSVASRRNLAFALVAFATIALVLAVGGIYAALSYVVGRRRQEIGIRIALGAQRRQVLVVVVRQGVTLVASGLAIGLPTALLAARLLGTLLYGVTASDAWTYVAVGVLLTLTGAIASLVPARRAAAVDPRIALVEGS